MDFEFDLAAPRLFKKVANPAATLKLGTRLARRCPVPTVIHLQGDLGTGKTTLARGFLRGLGFPGRVKSPTYTLLEPYELERCSVYHLDLYRLTSPEELEFLGARECLHSRAIWLVEWPDHGGDWLPAADLIVELQHSGEARLVRLSPRGIEWERALREAGKHSAGSGV